MLSFRLAKQTNKYSGQNLKKKPPTQFSNEKKTLKKEILIDYSLSCICHVSVMEFWTIFNNWFASWIQDVAIKDRKSGRFSTTFVKIQSEIKAIAVDSFCSSFCHQEKPKQPSCISLWNALLRILRLPMQVVSVMITQPPFLRRNLASLRRSKA